MSDEILLFLVFGLPFIVLVFAVIGTALGLKSRLVVYASGADAGSAWAVAGTMVAGLLGFIAAPALGWTLEGLALVICAISAIRTFIENRGLLRSFAALASKVGLPLLAILSVVLALGSIRPTAEAVKKRKYAQAATHGAIGAAGAGSAFNLRLIIRELTEKGAALAAGRRERAAKVESFRREQGQSFQWGGRS